MVYDAEMVKVKAWPNADIRTARHEFANLINEVDARFREDPSDSILSRFLLVRSSGYLEYGFETVLCGWAEMQSSPRVSSFVRSNFGRGRNPSPEKLCDVLGRFDTELRIKFEERISEDDDHVKREISWMVDRRNKIVHGLSENVRASKALDVARICYGLVDWLIEELRPGSNS